MRIGLTGGASSVERMVEQAVQAEADGFASLWYASAVGGDPLVAMAFAGKATNAIELGTSVLQTYTCHPVLQANRAASTAAGMGRPGLTIGLGPSHQPAIEDAYGLSYATPGRHTEEYVRVLAPLLRGETVDHHGDEFDVHLEGRVAPPPHPVSLMISALAPRLLRVAGQYTDGTILWMGNARAVETHVLPRITKAAADAGRPSPRIVCGLPIAVTDDEAGARVVAAEMFAGYGVLPNYRRILDIGGADGPADAAIVGDEASAADQVRALADAGVTDFWAAPFPVGADRRASRQRTVDLLRSLL
ncbi:MAG: TIGR03564 family F420-dependent LLM class oxidoreductase [Acidimicrobiia bacterium]|nr:TIGR03564 family F420-dependent LLM class oxidoreductase [Acidimicrobiia bacterium]